MAGVTVDAKNYRGGGWTSPGGWNDVTRVYGGSLTYRVAVDYSGAEALTYISFTLGVKGDVTQTGTMTVRLYSGEPISSYTQIGEQNLSGIVYSPSGTDYLISFSGLNVTSSNVYLTIQTHTPNIGEGYRSYVAGASGGTPGVSASFRYAQISMSLSSSSVSTGSNQVATFTNGSGRSVSVSIKFNNTVLWSGATSSGSLTIPVSKTWFTTAGITTSQQFSVSIQATETYTGTIYDSFYVIAGSDMKPTAGTPAASIVQASGKPTTYYPSTYLANISKAKVTVTASSGSNASISTVSLTYTGGSAINMTYNSSTGKYEATTPELTNSSTAFTVTVTDSRGMSASAVSSAVTVVQYSPPSLSVDAGATFRCTQGGNQDSGGAYFRAKAAASYYSALSGNSLLEFSVKIQGTQTTYNLTSGVQTGALDGTLAARTNYTLEFVIEDKVSAAVTKSFPLGSQVRDIVAIHNSTGTALGVGTTPQRAAGSSVEMGRVGDYLLGGIFAQAFPFQSVGGGDGSSFGKDFLNVERDDARADENASTLFGISGGSTGWSNLPSAVVGENWYGYRMVLRCSSAIYGVVVLEMNPTPGRIWVNMHNAFGWSGWKSLTPA